MDAMTAMTALHDALICGKDMEKIDDMFGEYRQAMEWATAENPTKESKKKADLIGTKLNKKITGFQKHVERFVNTHHVSPILSTDLPNIHVGFTKSRRWGDVKGNDVVRLQYPEWFQVLDLPTPKLAKKVFG